jgi:hypothetical protein
MAYITEERSDSKLAQQMNLFLTNAEKNEGVLGLDAETIGNFSVAFSGFQTALDDADEAKIETKAKVTVKNGKKRDAKDLIAQFAQAWRANPDIPDSVLDEMMVPNRANGGTRTQPTIPLNLRLSVDSTGEVSLAWDRNGNKYGTIFNIEIANSATGNYTTYDMTTKAKIKYQGTPGVPIWFRVNAKRNGFSSGYSLPISLWAAGTTDVLNIAA